MAAAAERSRSRRRSVAVGAAVLVCLAVLVSPLPATAAQSTFRPAGDFPTGDEPHGLALADLNGDGRLDMVVANRLSDDVSVLLNTTSPGALETSFTAPVHFPTGDGAWAVIAADFNGDGRPDLAVANLDASTVSVLLNTTPSGATVPSFVSVVNYGVGRLPRDLVGADFNTDGRLDLAVVNGGSDDVSFLFNTTSTGAVTPSFTDAGRVAAGVSPESIVAAHFDRDNLRPDIAVAALGGSRVFKNETPPGGSAASFPTYQGLPAGADLVAADLNGDSVADLAVLRGNRVDVLLNRTRPGFLFAFSEPTTLSVNPQLLAIVAADFDGDGRIDLAAVENDYGGHVWVFYNTTPPFAEIPSFDAVPRFAVSHVPTSLAAGDLNRDARVDVALTYVSFDLDRVGVFLNLLTEGGQTVVGSSSMDPGDTFTVGATDVTTPNASYRLKLSSTAEGCPTSPYVLGGPVVANGRSIERGFRVLPANLPSGVRWLCWVRVGDPQDHTVPAKITVF